MNKNKKGIVMIISNSDGCCTSQVSNEKTIDRVSYEKNLLKEVENIVVEIFRESANDPSFKTDIFTNVLAELILENGFFYFGYCGGNCFTYYEFFEGYGNINANTHIEYDNKYDFEVFYQKAFQKLDL